MKLLHQIPEGSKIFCEVSDGSHYVTYDHPDGMYSYCPTEKGGVVHIGLMQPLKEVEGGYKLATEEEFISKVDLSDKE